jgi:ABC-2 type transport system permease protein
VQTGGFDRFLVRPIDPLFHLLADRFCHDGIGNFLVGAALTGHALIALQVPLTIGNLAYLALMVLSGGVIFIALNLITCVSAFWVMDSVPVTRIIFELHEFAKYPVTMYGQFVGLLLTWVIPYALASFYPASYLLGRDVGWLAWAPPIAATVLLLLGYRFWQFGLRHYQSTGS